MKRLFMVALSLVMMVAFASPAGAGLAFAAAPNASGPQTYTVLVGAESPAIGVDLMGFFPGTLNVHVGDTVMWWQNSHEPHTVTFLAGAPLSQYPLLMPAPRNPLNTPLMFNPAAVDRTRPAGGMYNGTTYANSGLMSEDPGQLRSYSLTFTRAGTYNYICLVHGQMMSGRIIVSQSSTSIPSPAAAMQQGRLEIARLVAQVPALMRQAQAQVQPPTRNPNGTTTYHVIAGYSSGQLDLERFFPNRLTVREGDSIDFSLSRQSDEPHTVTFLNGNAAFPLIVPTSVNGKTLLLFNPKVVLPQNAGKAVTGQGVFSSGLLEPGTSNTRYTISIGDLHGRHTFESLLQASDGMFGSLTVQEAGPLTTR